MLTKLEMEWPGLECAEREVDAPGSKESQMAALEKDAIFYYLLLTQCGNIDNDGASIIRKRRSIGAPRKQTQ